MSTILLALGLVMIVEGLPYFAFPDKMKKWVSQMLRIPDKSLRRFGMLLMLVGLWMVYLGRR